MPQPDDAVLKICDPQSGGSNPVHITVTNTSQATGGVATPLVGCVINDNYFKGDTDGDNDCSTFPPGADKTATNLINGQSIAELPPGGVTRIETNITGLTNPACNRCV